MIEADVTCFTSLLSACEKSQRVPRCGVWGKACHEEKIGYTPENERTWNLKIPSWKRRNIYKPRIFGFHLNFQGCRCIFFTNLVETPSLGLSNMWIIKDRIYRCSACQFKPTMLSPCMDWLNLPTIIETISTWTRGSVGKKIPNPIPNIWETVRKFGRPQLTSLETSDFVCLSNTAWMLLSLGRVTCIIRSDRFSPDFRCFQCTKELKSLVLIVGGKKTDWLDFTSIPTPCWPTKRFCTSQKMEKLLAVIFTLWAVRCHIFGTLSSWLKSTIEYVI